MVLAVLMAGVAQAESGRTLRLRCTRALRCGERLAAELRQLLLSTLT